MPQREWALSRCRRPHIPCEAPCSLRRQGQFPQSMKRVRRVRQHLADPCAAQEFHDISLDGSAQDFCVNSPVVGVEPPLMRSEEHTSEIQSLMRISYAVFCLKKKRTNNNRQDGHSMKKKH